MAGKQRVGTAVLELTTDASGYVKGLGQVEKDVAAKSRKITQDLKSISTATSSLIGHAKEVQQHFSRFSGERVVQQAHAVATAVKQVGGVSKLTAEELQTVTRAIDAVAAKSKLRGEEMSASLSKLAGEAKGRMAEIEAATKKTQAVVSAPKPAVGGGALGALATGDPFAAIGKASGVLGGLGIGLSAAAALNFGKQILNDADALVKLSEKTGTSIEWLQKFQIAGDDAGNTVEEITGSIVAMQDRLASGDASMIGALRTLHLSLTDLRKLSPEQQFVAMSDAIRKIQDPAQRVKLAMDLFGRSGATVLPTLVHGFNDLRDASVGMSTKTVKTLEQVGDAWDALVRRTKGHMGTVLANTIDLGKKMAKEGVGVTQAGASHISGVVAKQLSGAYTDYTKPPPLPGAPRLTAGALPTFSAEGLLESIDAGKSASSMDALRERAREMTAAAADLESRLRSLTGQDVRDDAKGLAEAWKAMSAAQREDAGTINNVLAAYDQLRGKLKPSELPKDLETLRSTMLKMPEAVKALEQSATATIEVLSTLGSKWNPSDEEIAKFGFNMDRMAAHYRALRADAAETAAETAQMWDRIVRPPKAGLSMDNLPFIGRRAEPQLPDDTKKPARTFLDTMKSVKDFKFKDAAKDVGGFFKGGMNQVGKGMLSAIGGGIMTGGFSLLAGGAMKLIGSLLNSQAKQTRKMRDGAIAAAGGIDAVRKSAEQAGVSLDGVLNTKKVEAFKAEWEKLNAAIAFSNTAMDSLSDAEDRYHFTATKNASDLYANYQELIAAGHSQSDVLKAMRLDWRTLVSDALKYGTTLPKALEPILATLLEQGQLVDANGRKLTDLSGIKFGDLGSTAQTAFERITSGLDKLVAAIKAFLKLPMSAAESALLAGPKPKLIKRMFGPQGPGYYDENWKFYGTEKPAGFKDGTPNLDFSNFRAGTPAILHGDEAVVPRGGGHQLAAEIAKAGGAARGGTVIVQALDSLDVEAFLKRNGNARRVAFGVVPEIPGVMEHYGLS